MANDYDSFVKVYLDNLTVFTYIRLCRWHIHEGHFILENLYNLIVNRSTYHTQNLVMLKIVFIKILVLHDILCNHMWQLNDQYSAVLWFSNTWLRSSITHFLRFDNDVCLCTSLLFKTNFATLQDNFTHDSFYFIRSMNDIWHQ